MTHQERSKIEALEKRLDGIEAVIRESWGTTEHNTTQSAAKGDEKSPVQFPTFSDMEGLYILTADNLTDTALERFAPYRWLLGKIIVLRPSAYEDVPIRSWDEVKNAVAIVRVVVLKLTKFGTIVDVGVEFNFDLQSGNNLNGQCAPKRGLWISGNNYEIY